MAAMSIGFFIAQLLDVRERCHAIGERGSNGKNRILVDRSRDHFRPDIDTVQCAARHSNVSDPFAGFVALVEAVDGRTHAPEDFDDAIASRIAADVADRQIRSGNHRRRDEKKRRRRNIAGDAHLLAAKSLAALDRD